MSKAPSNKATFNVYTMMMILSFVALVVASVLLYLELASYGDPLKWWDTSAAQPPAAFHFPIGRPLPESGLNSLTG